MKKITRGKILGLVILALSLGFAGCAKKPDFSANVTVEAYYQGEKIDPKTNAVMKDKDQNIIFEAKALSGPFKVLETSIKKTKEGTDLIDSKTKKVVKQVTPIDKAKAVDKVSLALKVGDKIPNLAEKYEIRLADKVVPETPTKGTPEVIKKANEEAAKIRKENEDRKKFVFVGWFKDKDGKEPVNFDTRVTKGTKLVAIFAKPKTNTDTNTTNTVVSFRTESGVAPTHYEVASDDEIIARPVTIETIKEGTQAKPAYIMNNWLKASDGQPYDFSKSIKDNGGKDKVFPLVASWEKVQEGNVVVRFYTKQGVQNLPIQFKAGTIFDKSKLPKNPIPETKKANGIDYGKASVSTQAPTYAKDATGKLVEITYKPKLFIHWAQKENNTENTKYSFGNELKENLVLYAHWKEKPLALEFTSKAYQETDGSEKLVKATVFYGTSISESDIPDYSKLTAMFGKKKFVEWKYKDENEIEKTFVPGKTELFFGDNGIIKVTAKFSEKDYVIQSQAESAQIIDPATGNKIDAATANIKFLVTNSAGAEVSSTQMAAPELVLGDKPKLPETPKLDPQSQGAKDGYVFAGWKDENGSPFNFSTKITDTTRLIAVWEKPKTAGNILVSFVTDEGRAPKTKEVQPNDKVVLPVPASVQQAGTLKRSMFKGWTKQDGTAYDETKTLAENGGQTALPLKATWVTVDDTKVIVDFVTNQESVRIMPVAIEKNTKLAEPTQLSNKLKESTLIDKQVFKGWVTEQNGSTKVKFDDLVTSDKTIYADWASAEYTLIFENDRESIKQGGSQYKEQEIKNILYNTVISEPLKDKSEIKVVDGATFIHWTYKEANPEYGIKAGDEFDASQPIYANATLVPAWREVVYKVKLFAGIAPGADATTITISGTSKQLDKVDLVTLAETDVSKLDNAGISQQEFGYNDKLTTDAGRKIGATYSLSSPVINSNIKPQNDGVLNNGYKGWEFKGWKNGGKEVLFNGEKTIHDLVSTDDTVNSTDEKQIKIIELTADWSLLFSGGYLLKFNTNGHGTSVPTQTIFTGMVTEKPDDPIATHHDFEGWYETADFSGPKFTFNTNITTDKILNAKWKVKEYTISFASKVLKPKTVDQYYDLADFGFSTDDIEDKKIIYNEKVSRPTQKIFMPAHDLRWSESLNANGTCKVDDLFSFNKGVDKTQTLYLCDTGIKEESIREQMQLIPAKDYDEANQTTRFTSVGGYVYDVKKPDYDYYAFPYETTIGMFNKFVSKQYTLSGDDKDTTPIYSISYEQMLAFVKALNDKNPNGVSLKTKIENGLKVFDSDVDDKYKYKYAIATKDEHIWASLGTTKDNNGNDMHLNLNQEYSGANKPDANKNLYVPSDTKVIDVFPVGSYKANNFGLYFMSGNLSEAVSDYRMALGGSYNDTTDTTHYGAGIFCNKSDSTAYNRSLMPIMAPNHYSVGLVACGGISSTYFANNSYPFSVTVQNPIEDEIGTLARLGFRLYLVPKDKSKNRDGNPSTGN